MPSVCLCATEVRALYGLRLPAPEVGGARSLHATQLGATGGPAHPIGAFSTGVRVDWGLSQRPARVDCGLSYTTVQATIARSAIVIFISCTNCVQCTSAVSKADVSQCVVTV